MGLKVPSNHNFGLELGVGLATRGLVLGRQVEISDIFWGVLE